MSRNSSPDVSPRNREVVLTRAGIVSAVGVVLSVLAVFGVHVSPGVHDELVTALALVPPVVLPLGSALWSRMHVTPVYDPRDADGRTLVRGLMTDEEVEALRDKVVAEQPPAPADDVPPVLTLGE